MHKPGGRGGPGGGEGGPISVAPKKNVSSNAPVQSGRLVVARFF